MPNKDPVLGSVSTDAGWADFPNNDELEKVEAGLLNSDPEPETGSDGVETNAVKITMSHLLNPIPIFAIFVVVTCAAGVFKLFLKDVD